MNGCGECNEGFGRFALALSFASLVFFANGRGSKQEQGIRYLKTGDGRFASRHGSHHDPLRTLP